MSNEIERIKAYIARRKQSRGLDINQIHGFDVSPSGGFELKLSDIEALIAMTEAAPSVASGAPELPEPHLKRGEGMTPHYTKKQIRAYGQACAAAEREACAKLCETHTDPTRPNTTSGYAMWHAAAIRSRTP